MSTRKVIITKRQSTGQRVTKTGDGMKSVTECMRVGSKTVMIIKIGDVS